MFAESQTVTPVVSTDPAPPPESGIRFERDAILGCAERIVRSPEFRASKRNCRFLRRIVEMELDGKGGEVSGFLIGSEVFRRGPAFDHQKDPIVRIEAGKLRRDLEHYYLTAGRGERILISIPKGGYRPHFEERKPEAAQTAAASALDAAALAVASVRVSDALAGAQPPLRARLADGLAQKGRLAVFVAPEPESALLDSDAVRGIASRHGTAYVLSGDAWHEHGTSCFVARLHDGATGRQLWARGFRGSIEHVASQAVDEVAEAQRRFAASRTHALREDEA